MGGLKNTLNYLKMITNISNELRKNPTSKFSTLARPQKQSYSNFRTSFEKFATVISTSLVSVLATPFVAQAGVTPSLKNLINSVVAGGVVLAVIAAAVVTVSNFDPVDRA